jgi:hypothetical protein
MLALGLVAGMAIATYTERPSLSATAGSEAESPGQPGQAEPPVAAVPRPDSSWQIPKGPDPAPATPYPVIDIPAMPPGTQPGPGPRTTLSHPAGAYFTGIPADAGEAVLALATERGTYSQGGAAFQVDYRQMRQAGQGITVVGLIRVSAYPQWARTLQEHPAQLEAWLQSAAARVQTAAVHDRFFLSWAVVDTVALRPDGFSDQEITPLTNGTYLVVRPLAAVVDYAKTEIAVRPLVSLQAAAQGKLTAPDGPWAAYGPVLHFDSSDLYRPFPVGSKPANP